VPLSNSQSKERLSDHDNEKSKALSSREKVDDAKESQIDENSQAVMTEVD
jgi:hypothetical protein